jgi:hypothetical protein
MWDEARRIAAWHRAAAGVDGAAVAHSREGRVRATRERLARVARRFAPPATLPGGGRGASRNRRHALPLMRRFSKVE